MAFAYAHHTQITFLAMYWSGGGTKTIPEIIGAYDWINRQVITKHELEEALTHLLSASLLEHDNAGYRITDEAYASFEAFLVKRKANKFDAVRLYFDKLPPIENVSDEVKLSDEDYKQYLNKYHTAFRDALANATKSHV